MILALDPGNTESGWCLINDDYSIEAKGKNLNDDILGIIHEYILEIEHVVIEMIASYGMAVGQTVFNTCRWVGKFEEIFNFIDLKEPPSLLYRTEIKMNICGQARAKDTNIRVALIDRFSFERHADKGGKGTKNDPGFFFGFKSDIWAAYAVGVTYMDLNKKD